MADQVFIVEITHSSPGNSIDADELSDALLDGLPTDLTVNEGFSITVSEPLPNPE